MLRSTVTLYANKPSSRTFRSLLLIVSASSLSSCTTLKLVSDYDTQINSGVTAVLADTTTFVDKVTPFAGSLAGAGDANEDFYAAEEGKISALEARAEAQKIMNHCPAEKIVTQAVDAVGVLPDIKTDPNAQADFERYSAQIAKDDCEVGMLTMLLGEMQDMENFHEALESCVSSRFIFAQYFSAQNLAANQMRWSMMFAHPFCELRNHSP